jgi:hypothetical protein
VARYAVRMDIRTDTPLKREELERLSGAGYEIEVAGEPRRRTLAVSLVMSGGDVVGALARSMNVVLDEVAGEVRHAEVTEARPRPAGTPRRGRSGRRR